MKKLALSLCLLAGASTIGFARDMAPATDQPVDSIAMLQQQLNQISQRLDAEEQATHDLQQKQKWDGIWSRGKYTQISYGFSASAKQEGVKFNSAWNFGLTKGTSYFFPSKPIAGLLKVGFDIRWVDISATKYKKNVTVERSDASWSDFADDYDYDYDLGDAIPDIGHYDIHLGAFGIGPVVSVAPFSKFDNEARFVRATLYFHYQPTIGVNLLSEDGDLETSWAYCNMMDFGGKIQYRRIAIGLEGRWGSGKYSSLVSSDDLGFNEDEGISFGSSDKGKIKRNFSSTRIYIAFSF